MRRPSLLAAALLLLAACADPPPPVQPAPPPASAAPAVPAPSSAAPAVSATPAPAHSASAAQTASPAPAGTFTQLSEADEQRFVTPHLGDKKLAHPAFRGPFGPSRDAIVALTATSDAPPADLDGFVVVDGGRVLPLPKLHDQWSLWEVHAMMFEDVDGDGAKELIVIAEYVTGAGPTGAQPFNANAVVRWDGHAFVRVPAVEKKIEGLKDAAAVRKALRGARAGAK